MGDSVSTICLRVLWISWFYSFTTFSVISELTRGFILFISVSPLVAT